MKQQYELKIKSMQKFVPFLSKLLERLKLETGNEAKIEQMQLLLDLLLCQDSSVTIEELDKCEQALTSLFEICESDADEKDVETEKNIPEDNLTDLAEKVCTEQLKETTTAEEEVLRNSNESSTEKNCSMAQEEIDKSLDFIKIVMENNDEIIQDKDSDKKIESSCSNQSQLDDRESRGIESKISHTETTSSANPEESLRCENHGVEENKAAQEDENNEECSKNNHSSTCDGDAASSTDSSESLERRKLVVKSMEVDDIQEKDDSKKEKSSDSIQSTQDDNDSVNTNTASSADFSDNLERTNRIINDQETDDGQVGLDNKMKEFPENKKENNDANELENSVNNTDFASSVDSDEGDIEENVEIIKCPETESEEMILPDSADEANTNPSNEGENGSTDKGECEELHEYVDPTIEPELIAFESEAESKECEKSDGNDPLNVEENIMKETPLNADTNEAADEDDDDDVQVIETRNSPICIDSDDGSDSSPITSSIQLNNNRAKPEEPTKSSDNITSRNIISVRSPPNLRKRNKPQTKNSSVIDTIDILDSSDEEESRKSKIKINSPVKRCLLPKPIKPAKPSTSSNSNTINIRPQKRIAPKAPTQLHISTPQSNFLNAVNLQPANTANPAAFSAQLLNKNIIIPNAFYGNPPEVRGQQKAKNAKTAQGSNKIAVCSNAQQEQIYRRWLDNFLINFASPLQIASHPCFVLLQRVLKNKLLVKVKEARTQLNTMAQRQQTNATPASLDLQLMFDLRNTLYGSDAKLSAAGMRLCEFASSQTFGKQVPLTTDVKTGRVTSRTRFEEEVSQEISTNKHLNGLSKPTVNHTPNGCTKKKQKPDMDEYTPDKPVLIAAVELGSGQEERKRSLRTNRAKRIDHNFSYNEDQNDYDDEEDENDESDAAIRRKVEKKRQEAQQQRQKMAKSFESAFIEAFGKRTDGPEMKRPKICRTSSKNFDGQPASALLDVELRCGSGTFIPTHSNGDDADSLDDGPKEHRIYKVTPTALIKAPTRIPAKRESNVAAYLSSEVITCSDGSEELDDNYISSLKFDISAAPKNTNRSMHLAAINYDLCVICKRRAQRIVHHYVNDHRGCEVYTSRLPQVQVNRLIRNQGNTAEISIYRNGQNQYEATCCFCQKRSRFMLSYWYQHFTMHTGEYAYRCGGCGTRKPTRSLLHAHINMPCKKGGILRQEYSFDGKTAQKIEARICTICNFIQLHRSNIVQHLRTQHNLREILPKHIQSVILLQIPNNVNTESLPSTAIDETNSTSSSSFLGSGVNDGTNAYFDYCEDDSAVQFNYDEADPTDDLSFMICGMLDVQMSTE